MMRVSVRFVAAAAVMLLLGTWGEVAAQERGILRGQVRDAQTLQPVASAQLIVPELGVGSIARVDGRFEIPNVPAGSYTLRVQRIGYRVESQQITVTPGQTLEVNFNLVQDALALDEIVVTGTAGGTQRRAVGNVVDRVDLSAAMESRPITNVEQALSSAVPGLTSLGDGSNTVGGGGQIRLRGSSSPGLSGEPLIYIDGIRMNGDRVELNNRYAVSRLSDVDPRDIESIEVIKGPAAATLYGTEASNGVIQIITKRGRMGTPQFEASIEAGANWLPERWIPYQWAPHPETGEMVRTNMFELEAQRTGKRIFTPGPLQRYNVSVRGGTEIASYYASLSRSDLDGVTDWSWDVRNSGRAAITIAPGNAFNVDLSMSYMQGNHSEMGESIYTQNAAYGGRQRDLVNNAPNRGFRSVPEAYDLDRAENFIDLGRTNISLTVRHNPTSWLSHRLVAGIDDSRQEVSTLRRLDVEFANWSGVGDHREGSKNVLLMKAPTRTLDFSGTVSPDLFGRLTSATSYGLQFYNKQNTLIRSSGEGFATRPLTTVGAAAVTTGSEEFIENTTVGVYLQQQFGWENRLFVTGAIRADDNSAFGEEFEAAIYPKLSATWTVHEEPFWNIDSVDQLRVRTAWGKAGKQPDVFAATRLYEPVPGPSGQPALAPRTFGNPDLGPEVGEELEVGFDAELFGRRVDLSFTSFWRNTKDAIVEQPLAPSTGFTYATPNATSAGSVILTNIGAVSGWGTETALGVQLMSQDPVQWNMSLAFTTLGNRIDNLGGVERIPIDRGRSHVEGYPLASVFEKRVVSAEFVSGTSGAVRNAMCDGGTGADGLRIGGTPVPCADAPLLFWGPGEATRIANLNSIWNLFNDWQLSMTVDYRDGNWMNNDYLGARVSGYESTQAVFLRDNPVGVAYFSNVSRNGYTLTRGGFASLRELTLGYNAPSSVAERFGADRASISVGARNIIHIWRAQSHVEREATIDPDGNMPDSNFGGEHKGGPPPLTQLVARFNVAF